MGIELLARIGAAVDATGAKLYVTSFVHDSSTSLDAMVHVSPAGPGGARIRLAALRAASNALGLPLEVSYDNPDSLGLRIALDIDGVNVQVHSGFDGDDIPPARATLTESGPAPVDGDPVDGAEPTPADLAAITAEAPLIAAELAVVDAEIAVASDGESTWTARRLTAARRNLSTVATGFTPAGPDTFRPITPLSFHPTLRSA